MDFNSCWYKDVCTNDCSTTCVRFNEMYSLMEQSGIPEKRWFPSTLYPDDCDYDAFMQLAEIKNNIVDFVNNGKSLYIYSKTTGNGKTTWSIKLVLKYFNEIWAGNGFKCRAIFVNVPTFLQQLKNFNDPNNEVLKSLIFQVDLVVWDDIASTGLSSFDHTQLLTFIDRRVLECKSNIYTGNLAESDLEKSLGTRLASRVWNSSTKIKLMGKDNR